ncbi:MAG: class I SAM-dependent methyltransferase [Bacillota bacterium]
MPDVFRPIAETYDAWYQREPGRVIDEIEKDMVYRLLEPREGIKLLDVGCGTGNYALELARMGVQVTGVDVSRAMLDVAERKAGAMGVKLQLIHGDISSIDLLPESYDAVLCVTALEFFEDPAGVLAKCYRSLKPGGRMVVGVIAEGPWAEFYRKRAKEDASSVFNYATFYTAENLLRLLPAGQTTVLSGLRFPPDMEDFTREAALAMEKGHRPPGFICVRWVKTP